MEPWTGAQRAFAMKAFYINGDSSVIVRREFRREFGIHRNRAVPLAHAIKTWVRNLEATGSALKKIGGSVKTVRTPENIAVVRDAIERSPHRSARRHSVSLGLSEASVRRILHKEHSSGVETSNSARSLSVVRILSILYYCIHIFQGFVYKLLFYCCVTLKHSC